MIGRCDKNAFAYDYGPTNHTTMNIVLPLDKMSVDEKLKLMEEIWADLSRNPDNIPVPQWHLDLLREREHLVEEGQAHYVDWETAKKQIDDAVARGRTNED